MVRCSMAAFSLCPDAEWCGSFDDAVFMEGTECDRFNRNIGKKDYLLVAAAMAQLGRISQAAAIPLAVVNEILKGNHV